jgi:hypothetical protein
LRIEFEKEPADVGMEETFLDVVGIFFVVGVLVVPPMFARPHEDGIFESARAEEKHEQTQRPFCFVGFVREEPVIASCDTESGQRSEDDKHPALKPVEAEEPEINRQTGNREERRSDEERAGEPIDTVPWQGKDGEGKCIQTPILSLKVATRSAREHDIFLCPAMDLAAMGAG